MGKIVALRNIQQSRQVIESQLVAPSTWDGVPDDKRTRAQCRLLLVRWVQKTMGNGGSQTHAAAIVAAQLEAGVLSGVLQQAAMQSLTSGGVPGTSTLSRWCTAFNAHGLLGLADKNYGQPLRPQDWHNALMALLQTPPVKYPATYARILNGMGFRNRVGDRDEAITAGVVRRFLDKMPAGLFTHSPQLYGERFHQQNFTPYRRINHATIPPGNVWEADGHTLDWYTAHHNSGKKFRYELIVIKDKGSGYICGWWLTEFENAMATLYALRHAIERTHHVPLELHTDTGPGYDNELIRNQTSGFAATTGITMTYGIPRNARGHGGIESEWRWFEERCGKLMGRAYCGKEMPKELFDSLDSDIEHGNVVLPTLEETLAAISSYFEYRCIEARKGKPTRAELFAQRKSCEPPADIPLPLPRERRTVSKNAELRIFNRAYRAATLMDVRGTDVLIEYNIHAMGSVRVLALDGRWLCDAARYDGNSWKTDSLVADMEQKRLKAQLTLIEHNAEEKREQARHPIDVSASHTLDALEQRALPAPERTAPLANVHTHLLHGRVIDVPASAPVVRDLAPARERLRAELEADDAPVETTTTHDRIHRALTLEAQIAAGETVPDEDARWLAIYASSDEYHSRRSLLDDFDLDQPET